MNNTNTLPPIQLPVSSISKLQDQELQQKEIDRFTIALFMQSHPECQNHTDITTGSPFTNEDDILYFYYWSAALSKKKKELEPQYFCMTRTSVMRGLGSRTNLRYYQDPKNSDLSYMTYKLFTIGATLYIDTPSRNLLLESRPNDRFMIRPVTGQEFYSVVLV